MVKVACGWQEMSWETDFLQIEIVSLGLYPDEFWDIYRQVSPLLDDSLQSCKEVPLKLAFCHGFVINHLYLFGAQKNKENMSSDRNPLRDVRRSLRNSWATIIGNFGFEILLGDSNRSNSARQRQYLSPLDMWDEFENGSSLWFRGTIQCSDIENIEVMSTPRDESTLSHNCALIYGSNELGS